MDFDRMRCFTVSVLADGFGRGSIVSTISAEKIATLASAAVRNFRLQAR